MARVVVITPPDPVLSVADAKAHLRVSGAADDDMIAAIVAAAVGMIDGPQGWLGRALGSQTLELLRDDFPCAGQAIQLPYPEIGALVSITYEDGAGADRVLPPPTYKQRGETLGLMPGFSWPSTSGQIENVRIRYRAGYETVPAPILAAIKLMVGNLYSFARADSQLKKEVVEGVGSNEWDLGGSFDIALSRAVASLLSSFHLRRVL